MITIKEVAELSGVSTATVSRVINGSGTVSKKKEKTVRKAMKDLGYKPNTFARSLASNKSDSIGLIVGDLEGAFYGSLMKGVEQVVEKFGKYLIVASGGHSNVKKEKKAVDFLLSSRCDALIVHLAASTDDDIIKIHKQEKIPLIHVNRYIPELRDSCIYLDNEKGGRLATEHLVSMGHQEIACVTGPLSREDSRERLFGYRSVLSEKNIMYQDGLVIESDFSVKGGFHAAEKLLKRSSSFSAVFFENDNMAFGAIRAFREAGLRVPEDISVVGYDNSLIAQYISPELTSIDLPIGKMAEAAAELAFSLISGAKGEHINRKFHPELVKRNSVADRT